MGTGRGANQISVPSGFLEKIKTGKGNMHILTIKVLLKIIPPFILL
jgi:hypothetical protein